MKKKKKKPDGKAIAIARAILETHKEAFQELAKYDITFCSNDTCPMKKDCHRSLGNLKKTEGRYLSVSHFEPEKNKCKFFMEIKK